MIRKIQGTEKIMLEKVVMELKGKAYSGHFLNNSINVQRGYDIVVLERHETNPNKSFITIKKILAPNGVLEHDRARIEIDNNTGNAIIIKNAWEFLSNSKILKQFTQFLKDVQPESRVNPERVQSCSYGILGEIYGKSTSEQYKDYVVKLFDRL